MEPSLGAQLFGQLITSFLGSILVAMLLRLAAKLVMKMTVPFGRAYFTVLIPALISAVLQTGAGYLMDGAGTSPGAKLTASLSVLAVSLIIQALVIRSVLRIDLARAAQVTFVMLAVSVGIAVLVVFTWIAAMRMSR